MRIYLDDNRNRTVSMQAMLWTVERLVGIRPGPMVSMTYKPQLIDRAVTDYTVRGMRGERSWSKGEAELFGAFVSNLNTCHF